MENGSMRLAQALKLSYLATALLISVALTPKATHAQCATAPGESGVAAAPSRPNYANTADILQEGVTEFEYGYSHSWMSAGSAQSDLPGLMRFAPTCNFELRIGSDNLESLTQSGQTVRGLGDSWITGQYEFWKQTARVPSLAFSYGVKLPFASADKGLGTGKYDHAFTFLTNRTVGKTVFTFNDTYTLAGRASGSGFDRNTFLAGNFARLLRGPIGFTGELYGATRLNPTTSGYTGTLWAVTYTKNPRLVFDAGVDMGLTAGIPHQRAYFGMSYAVGEMYNSLRQRSAAAKERAAGN
jgi:Putative MetA-pathway of phenol degradation